MLLDTLLMHGNKMVVEFIFGSWYLGLTYSNQFQPHYFFVLSSPSCWSLPHLQKSNSWFLISLSLSYVSKYVSALVFLLAQANTPPPKLEEERFIQPTVCKGFSLQSASSKVQQYGKKNHRRQTAHSVASRRLLWAASTVCPFLLSLLNHPPWALRVGLPLPGLC